MTYVEQLLATVRVNDARYVRIAARAPWGIAFPARDVARLILATGDRCWLTGTGIAEPQPVVGRACFLIRAGATFELQDRIGRPLIDCDAKTTGPDLTASIGGDGGLTVIASSRFAVDPTIANALLDALPTVTTIDLDTPSGRRLEHTFGLVAAEADGTDRGSRYIAGRLTEILFLQALRAGYDHAAESIGWLAALNDPRLGPALREFHSDPGHPWTVDELARAAQMSRTSFLVLFKKRTGGTPYGYLTLWRMFRVKQLLAETDRSIADIAAQVGYRTGPSLSRAFTRAEGVAPGRWRADRAAAR